MLAPAAYQNGPEMPNVHATLDDWSSVAAHVHWDTITLAVSPVFTSRPPVLKCSDVILTPPNFFSIQTSIEVKIEKKTPNPSTMAKPRPREIKQPELSDMLQFEPAHSTGLFQFTVVGLKSVSPSLWPRWNQWSQSSAEAPFTQTFSIV